MSNKSLFGVIATSGFMLAAGVANATVMPFTSASSYNAYAGASTSGVSDPVDWGQFSTAQGNGTVNDSTVANGAIMTTSLGETVTATNGGSSAFTVFTNGATGGLPSMRWDGDFANGANILLPAALPSHSASTATSPVSVLMSRPPTPAPMALPSKHMTRPTTCSAPPPAQAPAPAEPVTISTQRPLRA
jgi:hypothetical protein